MGEAFAKARLVSSDTSGSIAKDNDEEGIWKSFFEGFSIFIWSPNGLTSEMPREPECPSMAFKKGTQPLVCDHSGAFPRQCRSFSPRLGLPWRYLGDQSEVLFVDSP